MAAVAQSQAFGDILIVIGAACHSLPYPPYLA